MARRWISGAIKRKGALTRKAKAAGKTVKAFCAPVLRAGRKTRTYSQCLLARTMRGFPKRGRRRVSSPRR